MKTLPLKLPLAAMLLLATLGFQLATAAAATSISATNHFAWGANFGWLDWRGDTSNGAVIGSNFCSGHIYAANVGWIKLGAGTPANGTAYQNNSAVDFGVNVDAAGNLAGYAYGANIGWIAFEPTGAPKVNRATGTFGGCAYSANCGWLSLSNAFAFVGTDPSVLGGGAVGIVPQFSGYTFQPNGSFLLYGAGDSNTTYTVYANTNLNTTNWISIGTTTSGQFGTIQFFDVNAGLYFRRFYRLAYP